MEGTRLRRGRERLLAKPRAVLVRNQAEQRLRILECLLGRHAEDGLCSLADEGVAPGPIGMVGPLVDHSRRVRHDVAIPRLDRKSTRLNSSHMSISYAVF